jgi:tRNA1Val (adenine37-N6)-methyltransferase
MLARYVKPAPHWYVADLGCGNGLVGLLMAQDQPLCQVMGFEIQEVLVRQAAQSAKLNHLSNIRFLRADLRQPPWKEDLARFDLVAVNPPYRKMGTGRISPDPVRAAARHELCGDVNDFALNAAALLREGCSTVWIYLAERQADLVEAVRKAGMEPVRYRHVVSRERDQPSLILLEAIKGEGPGRIYEEEPLILYKSGKGREYTDEARSILFGDCN